MSTTAPAKKTVTKKMPLPITKEECVTRYDLLGLLWEPTPCRWHNGSKDGMWQHIAKDRTEFTYPDTAPAHLRGVTLPCNAVWLKMDGLLLIDIDEKNDDTERLRGHLEPVAKMIAKTPKGWHYTFKNHPLITKNLTNINGAHVDVKTGPTNRQFVAPTAYEKEGMPVKYEWVKLPSSRDGITDCPQAVIDWLLKDPNFGAKKVKKPKVPKVGEEPKDESECDDDDTGSVLTLPDVTIIRRDEKPFAEKVDLLLSCLQPDFLADYFQWSRLGLCLKHIGGGGDTFKEHFLKHSRRSPKHDNDETQAKNAEMWDAMLPNGRLNLGSLKYWARKGDKDKYFANAKDLYWSLVESNDANAYCEMFVSAMGGDIVYSQGHKCYYLYDEVKGLWVEARDHASIHVIFQDTVKAILLKMVADTYDDEEMPEEEQEKRLKKLKKALERLGGGNAVVMMTRSFLPHHARPFDDADPALYFNQLPNLYPLENGVWNFKEGRLVPYDRNYYFTFKVRIRHNPKADTSHIRKAIADWFPGNEPLQSFIQYWFGYCLTSDIERQQFLIVIGTNAGNGKTLLWELIMGILTGFDKENPDPMLTYFHSLSQAGLVNDGANNDDVYFLNGKRYALLAEPSKKEAKAIDTPYFKKLTGDAFLSAMAKYRNKITFINRAKFVILCNELPKMELQEPGMFRRVLVTEQNVTFHIDKKTYEATPQAERDAGKHRMRDNNFCQELLANREGLLLWALEGASEYAKDPQRQPPDCMFAFKDKAVGQSDAVGSWLKNTLINYAVMEDGKRPSGWRRERVTFHDLRNEMKNDGINTLKDKAFSNENVWAVAEKLGFDLQGRPGKGDATILGACLRREVEETNELIH